MKPKLGTKLNGSHFLSRDIMLWPFNEAGGNYISDIAGNPHGTPTFVGSPIWTPSLFGPGLYFDGSSQITFPDGGPTDISGAGAKITLLAWARLDSTAVSRHLINKYTGTNYKRQYQLYFYTSYNSMHFSLSANGISSTSVDSSNKVVDGKWHQIVATYDGSYMRVYIDGLLDCTPVAHAGGIYGGDQLFRIGGYSDLAGWPGMIDHVMVLPRALNAAEIALLYRQPFCMFDRVTYVKLGSGAEDVLMEGNISAVGSIAGTLTVPPPPTVNKSRVFGRAPRSYSTGNCITRRKVFV